MRTQTNNNKKVYVLKTYTPELYKWSPYPDKTVSSNKTDLTNNGKRPFFCTATAGSQGQDWTTSYVFDLIVINGQQERLAYVECGYVE